MTATEATLSHRVSILEQVETRFTELVVTGKLASWPAEDVRAAVQLSLQHKLLAIQAIERRELIVAITNLDTVIYLISGFVEDGWTGDDLALN
jgi:hypothetical protein